jgi:glycerophosphoryl diester phosphodiesterase
MRKHKGKNWNPPEINTIKNIFKDLSGRRELGHGVIVCGSRGGALAGFLLDNTIAAFRSAIKMGLKMVSLDVWLTKDDQLVVTEGGENGEMFMDINARKAARSGELKEIKYLFE